MFLITENLGLYFECIGFAAARIAVLALS